MQRRKKRTLAFGGSVLAFYLLHFGWFLLFGPPQWFQGVADRAPQFTPVALDSSFRDLLDEFDRPRQARLGGDALPVNSAAAGRVVRQDRLGPGEPALQQTREGGRDHLYVLSPEAGGWREQATLRTGRLEDARWLRADGIPLIVLARRRPWWPFGRNYARFWLALARAELRPEVGLTLGAPADGADRYLFPGRSPLPSPDRGTLAFLRSEARGFHSIHVWTPGAAKATTVASLWEADPGSGVSFHYVWSSDSEALFIRGAARGFDGAAPDAPRSIRLLYDVKGDRLVDLGAAPR